MSIVSSQIQRAITEAFNEQVLPQIQATLWSGQGPVPDRGWDVLGRRPECRSEEALNRKFRSSSRDELRRNFNRNEELENTHYSDPIDILEKGIGVPHNQMLYSESEGRFKFVKIRL